MDKTIRVSRLVEWSLATFHTAFFFALIFALLYVSGALAGLLASLNTLIGIGIYAVFWVPTWYCTHRAFSSLQRADGIERPTFVDFILLGSKWGAVDGFLIYVLVVIFGSAFAILFLLWAVVNGAAELEPAPLLLYGTIVVVVGLPFAFVIGGIIGIVFGIIDAILAAIAFRIFNALTRPALIPSETHS